MPPLDDSSAPERTQLGRADRAIHESFRRLAAWRRAPAFHPEGVTYTGVAEIAEGCGLGRSSSAEAVVRLSRGIGWNARLPDLFGVAIRLVAAHTDGQHQDLLLTSAGSAPVARHVLRPTRRFDHGGFTTILPYRHAGRLVLFRCGPLRVGGLAAAASEVPFDIQLQVASPFGRWREVATVHVTEHAPLLDGTRFDPGNTGADLQLAGLVNRARRSAYPGSRAGGGTVRPPA